MSNANNTIREEIFLNHLWGYFVQHSNQRIQLVNFYIVLETFLFTGMFSILNQATESNRIQYKFVCILISVAGIIFSFVFYNLDVRTKQMIKNCEDSIKSVERRYIQQYGNELMIFCKEETNTNIQRRYNWFPLSYAKSFGLLFALFSLIGAVCLVYFVIFYGKTPNSV